MSKHLEKLHVIHLGLGQHDVLCDPNYKLCVVQPTHCVMANTMGCVAWWFGQTWVSWYSMLPPPHIEKNKSLFNEYLGIFKAYLIIFFKSGKWTFPNPPAKSLKFQIFFKLNPFVSTLYSRI